MRRQLATLLRTGSFAAAALALVAAAPERATAQTRPGGPVPGAQQSRVHGPGARFATGGRYQGGGNYGGGNFSGGNYGGYNRGTSRPGNHYIVNPGFGWGGYYPYYGAYGGYPYYGSGYGGYYLDNSSYYNSQYFGPYYYPPVFVGPDEGGFGPAANQRFLGLDQQNNAGRGPLMPDENQNWQGGLGELADEKQRAPGLPRPTNEQAHARAWRSIDAGDALFAEQKYNEAYQRYRRASQAAPDLADTYFRQGFGQLATGRFDIAARTFKRGLQIDPDWPSSGFQLSTLYGDDNRWATEHLEAIAKTSEEMPQNADLLFLLGVQLHFGGNPERARAFFERAQKLVVNDRHLQPFLQLDVTQDAEEGDGREL